MCVCVWTQLLEIVCLGLLSNLSSFQLLGFPCSSAVCAFQESVPQSCVSSGGSMVGIMVTSSKRAYAIPRSTAPRAPGPAAVHCRPVPPQEMLKHSSASVSVGLWVLVHTRFVGALWASLAGMGFDSKHDFVPSTILLGLLLCPWTSDIFFWWDPTFSCQRLFSSEL